MSQVITAKLLTNQTATGAGAAYEPSSVDRTFEGTVDGTGAISATIVVEVTNEADADHAAVSSSAHWLTLGTITLSGTTAAQDGFASKTPWRFVRGNVTAISGTGAKVNLSMGAAR